MYSRDQSLLQKIQDGLKKLITEYRNQISQLHLPKVGYYEVATYLKPS